MVLEHLLNNKPVWARALCYSAQAGQRRKALKDEQVGTRGGLNEPVLANLGAAGGIFNHLGNYDSSGFAQLDDSVLSLSPNARAQGS